MMTTKAVCRFPSPNFQLFYTELSDVVSVISSGPSPGAPKKVDDKAFFDVSVS